MLLRTFSELTQQWAGIFAQQRTHMRARLLVLALVCGVGVRTITRALGFLGKTKKDWSADYKFFSRSKWDSRALFTPVLREAIPDYLPEGPIHAALDDTVVPRSGKKIQSAAWLRNPMSPPFHTNLIYGQRFLQTSLLLPLYRHDGQSSPRALPIAFEDCPVVKKPGKKATEEERKEYRQLKKKQNLSHSFVQSVQQLRLRLDELGMADRLLLATGDGSYCNRTTFRAHLDRTSLVCRARKDLRLCFPHEGGGRRFYGQETFTPEQIYNDDQRPWKQTWIFHGRKMRLVRYKEVTRVLWQKGGGRKLLRLIVLAPTPYLKTKKGRRYYRQKAFLLTTDLTTPIRQLIQAYFDRFEIEFNHRDEKSILGVGDAQVWADRSVPRVPEFIVAGYSLLLLAGLKAYGPKRTNDFIPLPKWRRKANRPSCQDLITLLRKQIAGAKSNNNVSNFANMILQAAA